MKVSVINKNFYIVQSITVIRLLLTFTFLFFYLIDLTILAISVFIIAGITDILDGWIARKLNGCSDFGCYFDVSIDFFLILSAFISFVIDGIYPYWVIIIICFVFLQFILTSKFKILIYDPVGKYWLVFLIIVTIITLVFPYYYVYYIMIIAIISYSIVSLISRIKFLYKLKINSKRKNSI
ncbi:MAG: CDP-alcohol phosphatidyltransferase family protein [Candidatus Odinarchaeota archaeon]